MVGEFCNWKVDQGYSLTNEGSCNWSYTITKPTSSFKYKFVDVNGSTATRWESDPNRTFSLSALTIAVNASASGKYESCSYTKTNDLVTLTCIWR